MNAFRLLFLLLVFAAVMLGLSQNTETLGLKAPLELDLWFTELAFPQMAMYIIVFLCFLLGIIFGVITFFPANREAREKLKIQRKKLRLLQEDLKTAEMERARHIMKRQEKITPDEEAFKDEIVSSASSRAWGKAAMAGCVVLFVILIALYYYGHTELEKVHKQASATKEKTTGMIEENRNILDSLDSDFRVADQKLGQLDSDFRDEAAKLQERTISIQEMLEKHSREISKLQLMQAETRDYLTLMQLEQHQRTLDYLKRVAETDENMQPLLDAADEVREALEYYREKLD
ncbi:LapA family protein [Desulfonatronospira sp.]|uniref:LapA family protein n=1 Tax=Desulfonatronospira sp. TaxID=1962951 RepID=UPI0025BB057A|nr:LapA family protein [Desulfonatronospira sp.]